MPVLGSSWLGFCFALPAMEMSTLDFAMPLRSFLQPELVLFVLGLAHLDSLMFLRSLAHLEKILSASGCGRFGFVFSLPATEWMNAGSSALPKSPAKLELALPVLGCFETGLSLTSRGSAWPGLFLSSVFPGRPGLFSLVLASNRLASLLLPRSLGRSDSGSPVPSPCRMGSLTLPRGPGQADSTVLAWGLTRLGSVFLSSVCSTIHLDSLLLTRSSACAEATALTPGLAHMEFLPPLRSYHCPELSALVLDFLHPDLIMSARKSTCCGFPLSASHASRFASSPSVPNCAHPGLSAPLRSLARAGSACSVLRFAESGSSLSLRSTGQADAAISAAGLSRPGLAFALPVIDLLQPETPLLLRSYARPDVIVSALDFMGGEFALSAQSFVRAGSFALAPGPTCIGSVFVLPAVDASGLGSLLLPKSFGQVDLAVSLSNYMHAGPIASPRAMRVGPCMSASRQSRLDLQLSIPDHVIFGFILPLRSHAHLGETTLVPRSTHPDLLVLLRSRSRLAALASTYGIACAGPVFSLFVADHVCIGFSMLLQSPAQPGPATPVLGFARLGPLLLTQGVAKTESSAPLVGLSRTELVFSFLVLDACLPDASMFLKSLARPGSTLLTPDLVNVGSILFVQKLARQGSALSALDCGHSGAALPMRSPFRCGSTSSLSGLSRAGFVFALSVCSRSTPGSSLPPRSPARPGPAASAPGSLSFESTSLSQSLGRLGLSASALQYSHLGPSLSLQDSARSGSTASVAGCSRAGLVSSLPAAAVSQLDFSSSPRSSARVGLAMSALDSLRLEPFLSAQTPTHLGFIASLNGLARLDSPPVVPSSSRVDLLVLLRSFA